jgi:NTE family protein
MMPGFPEKIRRDRSLGRYAPKMVYVLSGGGASGLCHLGMIESLEKEGIKPDLIVGTSAGSLVGALYSHHGNTADVYRQVERLIASDGFREFGKKYFADRRLPDGHGESRIKQFIRGLAGTLKTGMHLGKALVTSAMVAGKDADAIFSSVLEGITTQTLKIPFAAVTVDLAEGAPAIFAGGDEKTGRGIFRIGPGAEGLKSAVMASCAIPLIFPAVDIAGHAHADGSIMANLPVRPCPRAE